MITHCPNCGENIVAVECLDDEETDGFIALIKEILEAHEALGQAYRAGLVTHASGQALRREMLSIMFFASLSPDTLKALCKPRDG